MSQLKAIKYKVTDNGFFYLVFSYNNLMNYYSEIGYLVRYSNYSLTEIEMMLPFEFDIFSSILLKQLKDEKNGK